MYIPMMKNRLYENKLCRDYSNLFCDEIVPMMEIIVLKIGRTPKSIFEIIENYNNTFYNNYFIDFFTFDHNTYRPYDPDKVKFSMGLQNEYNKYSDYLIEVGNFERAIPVISIKKERDFEYENLESFIKKVMISNKRIAVRIASEYFDEYIDIISPLMRKNDYIMLDINEDPIESKFMEIDSFKNIKKNYLSIILNSPRHRKIKNGIYENKKFTELIDNSLRTKYVDDNFSGYGDYAGLKDVLPSGGGNGQGSALGLFYLGSKNEFFSIVNSNTLLGASGHKYVIEELFDIYRTFLDIDNDCPMYEYIHNNLISKGKSGAWGQWKYITLLRYISQIKKSTSGHL